MGKLLLTLLLAVTANTSQASSRLLIAVASNFEPTARALASTFEQQHPAVSIQLSSAASGAHYHQISRGAPFALFLSADRAYPQLLADQGRGIELKNYARGSLVLACRENWGFADAMQRISRGAARIAIANPNTAPYGRAAQQVLNREGIAPPYVQGQNVGQALNFLGAGAVDCAFAARSQVMQKPSIAWAEVPAVYDPIDQAGLLLQPNNQQAAAFWHFLDSDSAKSIISSQGYQVEWHD